MTPDGSVRSICRFPGTAISFPKEIQSLSTQKTEIIQNNRPQKKLCLLSFGPIVLYRFLYLPSQLRIFRNLAFPGSNFCTLSTPFVCPSSITQKRPHFPVSWRVLTRSAKYHAAFPQLHAKCSRSSIFYRHHCRSEPYISCARRRQFPLSAWGHCLAILLRRYGTCAPLIGSGRSCRSSAHMASLRQSAASIANHPSVPCQPKHETQRQQRGT